jgi:hypothetical protein
MYTDILATEALMPAVLFYCVDTNRDHYLGGLLKSAHAQYSIDCYSNTRSGASALSKVIRECGIDSFRGTVDGFEFCGAEFISSDNHQYDQPTDGNRVVRYYTSFDVIFHYKEP